MTVAVTISSPGAGDLTSNGSMVPASGTVAPDAASMSGVVKRVSDNVQVGQASQTTQNGQYNLTFATLPTNVQLLLVVTGQAGGETGSANVQFRCVPP